jgi:hypothetical protein
MRTRTTNRPLGTDAAADFHNQQFERSHQEMQVFNSTTVKAHRTTRGIRFNSKPGISGQLSGFRWASAGKHYDPDETYQADELVVVYPGDTIVTAGKKDVSASGAVKKSWPGLWVAAQDVSPSAGHGSGGTDTWYYVPQWPLPVADDWENEGVFWLPFGGFYPNLSDCGVHWLENASRQV